MHNWRYTFQLYFDKHSEEAIRTLIARCRGQGLVNTKFVSDTYRPHLSLSVYRALDEEYAQQVALKTSKIFNGFDLLFSYVGLFNGDPKALYLGVSVSSALRDVHQLVHSEFESRPEECWELYQPETWVPHCGVLVDTDSTNLLKGASILINETYPQARIESIGVTGFRNLHEYPLG